MGYKKRTIACCYLDAVAGASDLCARTYFDSPMVKINEHGK
jgi:hypothetical protein